MPCEQYLYFSSPVITVTEEQKKIPSTIFSIANNVSMVAQP
jgi:hypothetical protein